MFLKISRWSPTTVNYFITESQSPFVITWEQVECFYTYLYICVLLYYAQYMCIQYFSVVPTMSITPTVTASIYSSFNLLVPLFFINILFYSQMAPEMPGEVNCGQEWAVAVIRYCLQYQFSSYYYKLSVGKFILLLLKLFFFLLLFSSFSNAYYGKS